MSVRAATALAQATLKPLTGKDWTVNAGTLDWSCWQTAAHIAHDLTAYAYQLAGLPPDGYLKLDLMVQAGATPAEVVGIIGAAGNLLGAAIDAADATHRAWHWGPTDPTGFGAMGVAETVLHTFDITSGLGDPWTPPDDLAATVINRLFPDAPSGPPSAVLLWCTGRGTLPGRDQRTSWTCQASRG